MKVEMEHTQDGYIIIITDLGRGVRYQLAETIRDWEQADALMRGLGCDDALKAIRTGKAVRIN